jgi:hypothetical protein
MSPKYFAKLDADAATVVWPSSVDLGSETL